MLAKIIVGVVGLLVVGAGGYAYWESLNDSPDQRCSNSNAVAPTGCSAPVSPCCDINVSCPAHDGDVTGAETLDIAPREAVVQ